MMDVDVLVEEHRLIERLAGAEILGAAAHQQGVDTFVGGGKPGAQGAQALLAEIRAFDRLRNRPPVIQRGTSRMSSAKRDSTAEP